MPVRKFRSIQDMPDDDWLLPGSPELFAAIRSVWDFSARTCPYAPPRGVYRHRGVEEARALRASWEREAFERARARRHR
jgi:hypothetical protein